VYAAHLLVLVLIASMLATTAAMTFNLSRYLNWVPFSSIQVLRGQAWRLFTYGFFNPPSLMFAVDMVMIALFGREVERVFGRRKFGLLYACLYLLPVLLLTAAGNWVPSSLIGETGSFALFVAFATLYPNAVMLFGILAKWAALVLVAIYSLMALAYHDWVGATCLWSTSGFAYGYVRYERGDLALPSFRLFRRRPKLRVIAGGRTEETPAAAKEGSMADVDALLDKIASSGIGSLTKEERQRLDAARERLARRSSGR